MANRYVLIDSNNNEYTIQDETIKLLDDEFSIEVGIVERSYKAGADFPGIQRDESKELALVYDINYANETSFRAYINNLTQKLRKTIVLKDIINNMQTDVLYTGQQIQYDEGGFNLGAKVTIEFKQLIPYWEDTEYQEAQQSGFGSGQLVITNTGYINTPPIITIQALEQITKFSVRIAETGDGIVVKDLQFGISGLNTYIIDNKEGTSELNELAREQKIQQGTGFFDLQVGSNTMEFDLAGNAIVTVQWKRRYYI